MLFIATLSILNIFCANLLKQNHAASMPKSLRAIRALVSQMHVQRRGRCVCVRGECCCVQRVVRAGRRRLATDWRGGGVRRIERARRTAPRTRL